MTTQELGIWVALISIVTLAMVVTSVIAAVVFGLFHASIDNQQVFEIIKPAFTTIVGGMLGLVSGIVIGKKSAEEL